MTELATRDGLPWPSGLPQGECICTRLDDGTIRIDHADPRILISGELLDEIVGFGDSDLAGNWWTPNAWLDTTGCMASPHRVTYVGAVLKISGVNRHVVYRIVEYVPSVHGYIGQWPD